MNVSKKRLEILAKTGSTDMQELITLIAELEAQLANFESDAYVLSLLTKIDELEGLVSDLECDVHFWKTKALAGEAK